MLKGSLAPEYNKIENIIYQRFPNRSTTDDEVLSNVDSQVGEAKKEEEND
jgi:hypothetical protein